MRRVRTEEQKKQYNSLEAITAPRSRSKQIMQRLKKIYKAQSPLMVEVNPIIGIKIKNNTPNRKITPTKDLKLVLNSKARSPARTPRTKSPSQQAMYQCQERIYQTNVNTGRRLQQLRKRTNQIKLIGKMNGTQKYFRKEKQKVQKANNNLNETLKMVWEQRPKRAKYQFKMIRKLGKSQTGQILLAISNLYAMTIAIKTFRKKQVKIDFLIDQIKIHLYCQHPNILPAYGIHISPQEVFLAMEVGQCNLYDRIMKYAPFDQHSAALYIAQVASGIAYLHENGIMHRDIKPENIICFGHNLKIADFGWSIITTKPRKTLCGTLDYLSPEVTRRQSYNNKIDCWSIGVLLYQMLTGQAPYPEQQKNQTFQSLTLPKNISTSARDLLMKVLQLQAVDRLSAKQILHHEWIKFHLNKQKLDTKKKYRQLELQVEYLFQ